jgi:hypothetical protein
MISLLITHDALLSGYGTNHLFFCWFLFQRWHFGTALGTYGSGLTNVILRHIALGRKDIMLKWFAFVLPHLSVVTEDTKLKKKR